LANVSVTQRGVANPEVEQTANKQNQRGDQRSIPQGLYIECNFLDPVFHGFAHLSVKAVLEAAKTKKEKRIKDMKTTFHPNNLAILAALAASLIVPGMAHAATCQIGAASALPYNVPAVGMVGTVTISAPATCPWTFTARGSTWIRILSATSGTGSAVVTFQVLPNTTGRVRTFPFGPEGAVRQTTQTIGTRSSLVSVESVGFTITVTQQ